MKILFLLAVITFLSGCTPLTYHPKEYVLGENRIDNFNVSGLVSVKNGSISEEKLTIFDDMFTWHTNRKELNSALSAQLQKEINRHGIIRGSKPKNLWVTINKYYA